MSIDLSRLTHEVLMERYERAVQEYFASLEDAEDYWQLVRWLEDEIARREESE